MGLPILLYLIIMNALGFALMLVDKRRARKRLWRIPERTLMTVAFFGGSLGSLAGMYLARHKTRHLKFVLGIPAFLLAHIFLAIWLLFA